jgi:transposase
MQADAYAGFTRLYRLRAGGDPRGGVVGACAAQVFRPARLHKAPIAIEAVSPASTPFAIEREINGADRKSASASATSAADLSFMIWRLGCASSAPGSPPRTRPPRRSTTASSAGPPSRFLDDGRLCLSNNAAARALRGIAFGRHSSPRFAKA